MSMFAMIDDFTLARYAFVATITVLSLGGGYIVGTCDVTRDRRERTKWRRERTRLVILHTSTMDALIEANAKIQGYYEDPMSFEEDRQDWIRARDLWRTALGGMAAMGSDGKPMSAEDN